MKLFSDDINFFLQGFPNFCQNVLKSAPASNHYIYLYSTLGAETFANWPKYNFLHLKLSFSYYTDVGSFYAKRPKFGEKKKKLKIFYCINFRDFRQYRVFRVLNFRKFGQNSRKFLLSKVSAPKVV